MITCIKSLRVAMLLRVIAFFLGFVSVFSMHAARALDDGGLRDRRGGDNSPTPSAHSFTPAVSSAVTDKMCEVIVYSRALTGSKEPLVDSVIVFVRDMSLASFEEYFLEYPGVIRSDLSEDNRKAVLKQFLAIFIAKITFDRPDEGGSKTEKQRVMREALRVSYEEKIGRLGKENMLPGSLHDLLKREIGKKR